MWTGLANKNGKVKSEKMVRNLRVFVTLRKNELVSGRAERSVKRAALKFGIVMFRLLLLYELFGLLLFLGEGVSGGLGQR